MDYDFHLKVALASGNLVYPLIINSFRNIYLHFTSAFFQKKAGTVVVREVIAYHEKLLEAIAGHKADEAATIMEEMLVRGERQLLENL